MTRSMDEVVRIIPAELEQAAYTLGATRLETALGVVTRQMLPEMITAVLLAFGRGALGIRPRCCSRPATATTCPIRNLSVYYDSTPALQNINLEIPKGQITVIIGPSGCGKTTLLKSLNCFLELGDTTHLQGQILMDGQDIYAPGVDVTEVRKKAGLWEEVKGRLHDPANGLSIAQQQRGLDRQAVLQAQALLLGGEPTSALDLISAQHIEARLHELKGRYTIVMVTHILRQACRPADYVVFMYICQVIEHGPAHQVIENPRQERTLAYLEGQF